MEEALRSLLLASGAITALVGDRVTWAIRPQGSALPAIVLWLVSEREGYTHSGPEGAMDSLVQVDCWASTFASAMAVSRAVRAALSFHDGGSFQGVFVETVRNTFDDEQPQPFHRLSLDIRVWSTAAAA